MSEKRGRAAFCYMEPRKPKDYFAECGTCRDFLAAQERCFVHGPDEEVDDDDTCGLYVHGPSDPGRTPLALVTPEESGLAEGPPRCENCASYLPADKACLLYRTLEERFPEVWDFGGDHSVKRRACCNAQAPAV